MLRGKTAHKQHGRHVTKTKSHKTHRKVTNKTLTTTHSPTFSTKTNPNDSIELPKGPILPEQYRLSFILNNNKRPYYRDHPNELSVISRRHVDKFGLFTRSSLPIFDLVPKNIRDDLKLDNRILYMEKGDVQNFVIPISLPDEIKRNKAMVDSILDKIHVDSVVVPLAAKPHDIKELGNPFERPSMEQIKFDIFDPESSPFPPRIRSGDDTIVETAQYTAYKAFDMNLDIALSGRLEVVSFNNWKYKSILNPDYIARTLAQRYIISSQADNALLAQAQNICVLPHTPTLDVLVETTFNFEQALIATATIRSTIEEQQSIFNDLTTKYNNYHKQKKLHDEYQAKIAAGDDMSGVSVPTAPEGPEPNKPAKRVVMTLIDTAQLRHFENTYDIIDLLDDNDFIYLKRGFEAYFDATKTPTLRARMIAAHDGNFDLDKTIDKDNSDSESSDDEPVTLSEAREELKADKTKKISKKIVGQFGGVVGELADPSGTKRDEVLQAHRAELFNALTKRKNTMSALTRPFSQIHLLYTSIYGPLADQGAEYCGQCKFEFNDIYLYTSEKFCEKKPRIFTRNKKCKQAYDWSFNPEALRFPPFDMSFENTLDYDKALQDNLNIDLFSQWMTLRWGLFKYEQETNEVNLQTIESVRHNIGKLFDIYKEKRTAYRLSAVSEEVKKIIKIDMESGSSLPPEVSKKVEAEMEEHIQNISHGIASDKYIFGKDEDDTEAKALQDNAKKTEQETLKELSAEIKAEKKHDVENKDEPEKK